MGPTEGLLKNFNGLHSLLRRRKFSTNTETFSLNVETTHQDGAQPLPWGGQRHTPP